MGAMVAVLVEEKAWGQCVVYRAGRVTKAPVEEMMGPAKLVTPHHHWVKIAAELGTFI